MSMMELLSQMRERARAKKEKEEKPAMVLYHHFG